MYYFPHASQKLITSSHILIIAGRHYLQGSLCLVVQSALANGGISRHDPSSSLKTICVVELLGCFASFGKHRPGLAARSQVSRMNLEQSPYGPTTADLWELTHRESTGVPALWCWGVWQGETVQLPQLPWPMTFTHDLFLSCLVSHTMLQDCQFDLLTTTWSPNHFLLKGTVCQPSFSRWRTVHYYS